MIPGIHPISFLDSFNPPKASMLESILNVLESILATLLPCSFLN